MSVALISGMFSQYPAYKLSAILKVPIGKVLPHQKLDRKFGIIAPDALKVDEIFVLASSVFNSYCFNDAVVELMLIINICRNRSKARITAGNELKNNNSLLTLLT